MIEEKTFAQELRDLGTAHREFWWSVYDAARSNWRTLGKWMGKNDD